MRYKSVNLPEGIKFETGDCHIHAETGAESEWDGKKWVPLDAADGETADDEVPTKPSHVKHAPAKKTK